MIYLRRADPRLAPSPSRSKDKFRFVGMNSDLDVPPRICQLLVLEGFRASLVDPGNYKLCFLSEETLFIVHSLHSEHPVPTPS